MADKYITRLEVAEKMKVSLRTVDRLKESGKLPFYKIGSKITRFKESDIDAFLEKECCQ